MKYLTDERLRELANKIVEESDPFQGSEITEADKKDWAELIIPILRSYLYLACDEAREEGKEAARDNTH